MHITLDVPQLGATRAPMRAQPAKVPQPRQLVDARPVKEIRDDEQKHDLCEGPDPQAIENAAAEDCGDIGDGQDAEEHGRRERGDRQSRFARDMNGSRRPGRRCLPGIGKRTGRILM
jgi:hypothetical protein